MLSIEKREQIKEKKRQTAKEIVEKCHFPEIRGVSEKQVNYANALRDRALLEHPPAVKYLMRYDEVKDTDIYKIRLKEFADAKYDGDIAKAEKSVVKQYRIDLLLKLRKMDNASQIIDFLKASAEWQERYEI